MKDDESAQIKQTAKLSSSRNQKQQVKCILQGKNEDVDCSAKLHEKHKC